jgi:xylulokinase
VVTIETSEASPLGNAMLVGVEEGVFTSYEEVVSRFIKREKEYLPNQKTHDLYKELFALYNKVYNDLQPSFDSLADIKARLLG